ncbi:hypothetical protein [Acinetobacter sp. 1000160]|uniref:hypothetical protein n=1 Tax=Acinetobacter sp. 1000160 TaxID=1310800 RepID=UPI00044CF6E6|nr:hypothetical protein [Acinetobacter sp. 1000160]EXB49430.1 hypothetical protein J522_1009 [Acinetobacter baumannii 146457]EYT21392.1 hypothetical protein J699_01394 [Acinetobacter sp. 1000160]
MKRLILLTSVVLMVTGCDKAKTDASNKTTQAEVQPVTEHAELTVVEKEDLNSLRTSPIEETANQAEFYLNHLETSSIQEMRAFIKKGLEEWEAFNNERADPNVPPLPENTDASMEYRIEVKNHVYGSSVVETAYLNLISLSDSIEMDKLIVNRGNCRADYRSGANPITYGNSMRFFLNCDPRNIREVVAVLRDGRQVVMSPQ